MITVHFISIKKRDDFLEFKKKIIKNYSNYHLVDFSNQTGIDFILDVDGSDNENMISRIIFSDFENCIYEKWYLLQILDKAKDVIIFINDIVYDLLSAQKVKNLVNYENIIGNKFTYINYYKNYKENKRAIEREAKNIDINGVDLKRFILENINDISILVFAYIQENTRAINYDFNVTNILSDNRNPRLVFTRHLITYILIKNKYTTVDVGNILDRDHSTIIYSRRVFENYLDIYATAKDTDLLHKLINNMKKYIIPNSLPNKK